uniref:Uncharacterized protein n=1 Tax=Ciona intestinalis TaxID=7719 RepID=H2Y3B1_CIOIN
MLDAMRFEVRQVTFFTLTERSKGVVQILSHTKNKPLVLLT